MAWNRSSRLSVAAAVLFVTLGMLVGIAQAAPGQPRPPGCNPDGRYICISITDFDNVTHSRTGATRYTSYSAIVSNQGDSALTNGSARLALVEVVNGTVTDPAATAYVVAVPTGCEAEPAGSTTSFTCPLPNLGAGQPSAPIEFFAATSTNEAVDFLRLVVTATFKESASDNPNKAAQTDTFTLPEDTSLETGEDFSQSVVFEGGSTVLETLLGFRGQSSVFHVPVEGAVSGGFQLATLEEFSTTDVGDYFCPSGFSCFGQSIATAAAGGIFSADNLANLVTTMDIALLLRGVTEKSLLVHHKVGTVTVSFATACGGDLFSEPTTVPCRRVVIDKKAGIVTIDIWDNHQGDWGFS